MFNCLLSPILINLVWVAYQYQPYHLHSKKPWVWFLQFSVVCSFANVFYKLSAIKSFSFVKWFVDKSEWLTGKLGLQAGCLSSSLMMSSLPSSTAWVRGVWLVMSREVWNKYLKTKLFNYCYHYHLYIRIHSSKF